MYAWVNKRFYIIPIWNPWKLLDRQCLNYYYIWVGLEDPFQMLEKKKELVTDPQI